MEILFRKASGNILSSKKYFLIILFSFFLDDILYQLNHNLGRLLIVSGRGTQKFIENRAVLRFPYIDFLFLFFALSKRN